MNDVSVWDIYIERQDYYFLEQKYEKNTVLISHMYYIYIYMGICNIYTRMIGIQTTTTRTKQEPKKKIWIYPGTKTEKITN